MDDLFVSDDEAELETLDYSEVLAELKKKDMEIVENSEFEEGELKESCHICGKLVEHMDKHMLANHGEKVECQLCSKTFSMGNLRWHILKEHCRNKVVKCSLCEQNFVTKTALRNHVKQIHKSDTSTCYICHKEYKDIYHHVKYFHRKIRNYKCSYCEKKFQAKKMLYNHVQSIHLGEKTNCPTCKKDISVDNFNRHVREFHEKIRKTCPHCKKEYGMSNLSKHVREVHNKICDICNAKVSYSISVHKRQVHNIGKLTNIVKSKDHKLKLRQKRQQEILNNEEYFNHLNKEIIFEDNDLEEAENGMDSKTLNIGEKNFTFSFV